MSIEKAIAVVGGGSTSLGVNEGIIFASTTKPSPAFRLPWITNGKALGCGAPWEGQHSAKPGAPITNQPLYAMSPFHQDPEDCVKATGAHRHHFDTRYSYGDYLAGAANRLISQMHDLPQIAIDPTRGDVRAITVDNGRFHLHLAGQGRIVSDRVILAAGHTPSHALDHLRGHPGYVESPTDQEDLSRIASISRPDSVVTFNGAGDSTLDAIKYLEENGYRGTYSVVARGLNYWPFEPEKYDPLAPPVRIVLGHHTVEAITKTLAGGADVHKTLMATWRQRPKRWDNIGFQHVLDSFPFTKVAACLRDHHKNEAAARAVETYHDHLTSPQSYEMVQRLLREKRLDFRKGWIEEITQDVEGFTLHLEGGGQQRATRLINAVPFVKGVGTPQNGHTELFRQLIADGLVRIDAKGIVQVDKDGQASPGLYVVGPASHGGKAWGVESFRGLAHRAGVAAVTSLCQPA